MFTQFLRKKREKTLKTSKKKPGGLANVSEKSDQTGQASNVAMLCLLYCNEVVPSRASSSGSVRGSSVSADQAFHLGHPRPRHVGNPEPNGCLIAMRKIARGYCKLAWKWWRYPKISQFEDIFMGKLMTNYWIWGSCMIFGLKELKPATPIFKFITLIYYLELLEGGRSTCFFIDNKEKKSTETPAQCSCTHMRQSQNQHLLVPRPLSDFPSSSIWIPGSCTAPEPLRASPASAARPTEPAPGRTCHRPLAG